MAGIRTKSQGVRTKVVTVRQPAPVVIREQVAPRRRRQSTAMVVAPRAAPVKRRRSVGGSSSSVGALTPSKLFSVGLGGAIYGYIEKKFPTLPTLPMIGRSGTIAVISYFVAKNGGMGHSGIVKDVGIAAAAIAGYQLGSTGKVSGDDVVGDDVVGEDQI